MRQRRYTRSEDRRRGLVLIVTRRANSTARVLKGARKKTAAWPTIRIGWRRRRGGFCFVRRLLLFPTDWKARRMGGRVFCYKAGLRRAGDPVAQG